MNDTSSPSPSGRLAFLHRRPFWAVVLLLQIAISLVSFGNLIERAADAVSLINTFLGIVGGVTFGVIADILFPENIADKIASIVFVLFYTYVLYQTFARSVVKVRYPIILTINWILTYLFLHIFLSSM